MIPALADLARFAFASLTLALMVCAAAARADAQGSIRRPTPAEFRGSNYLPATTMGISNALSMLDAGVSASEGSYSSAQVRAEIGQYSKAGLNCLRVFPSFYSWLIRPAQYMNNLRDLAQHCRDRRIVITYVMWSSTSNVFTPNYLAVDPRANLAYDASLHIALEDVAKTYTLSGSRVPYPVVLSFGEPWQFVLHDEPGNGLFQAPYNGVMNSWPNGMRQKCEQYVDAIGNFFANDPIGRAAFGSYDLFNEPDCCKLEFSREIELLQMTYRRLSRLHAMPGAPRGEFTVGFADYTKTLDNHKALVGIGIKQTYLSYHCYEQGALFDAIALANAQHGALLDMPVVCSEFYDKNKPGHLGGLGAMIQTLQQHGIGGNAWGFLATNLILRDTRVAPPTYMRLDGMLIPSATPTNSFSSPLQFTVAPNAQSDLDAIRNW